MIRGASARHVQVSKGFFRGDLLRVRFAAGVLDSGFYDCALHGEGIFAENFITVVILLSTQGEAIINGVGGVVPSDLIFMKEGAEMVYALAPETAWVSFQVKRQDLRLLGVDFGKNENKIYKKCYPSDYHFVAVLNSLAHQLHF